MVTQRDPSNSNRLQNLFGQNRSARFFVIMGAGSVVASFFALRLLPAVTHGRGPIALFYELLSFLFFAAFLAGFGIMAFSTVLSKRTINHQDPPTPSSLHGTGRKSDELPFDPSAGQLSDTPQVAAEQTIDTTAIDTAAKQSGNHRDLIGVTFAPTAVIWGMLLGFGAGIATDNFAVGLIVAIVASAVGWYVIQLFEDVLARSLLGGITALAGWLEARKPRDAQMQALRDRAARFVRSFDPAAVNTGSSGDQSVAAPLPEPGWYADPSGIPGERYWDGRIWTDGFRST